MILAADQIPRDSLMQRERLRRSSAADGIDIFIVNNIIVLKERARNFASCIANEVLSQLGSKLELQKNWNCIDSPLKKFGRSFVLCFDILFNMFIRC